VQVPLALESASPSTGAQRSFSAGRFLLRDLGCLEPMLLLPSVGLYALKRDRGLLRLGARPPFRGHLADAWCLLRRRRVRAVGQVDGLLSVLLSKPPQRLPLASGAGCSAAMRLGAHWVARRRTGERLSRWAITVSLVREREASPVPAQPSSFVPCRDRWLQGRFMRRAPRSSLHRCADHTPAGPSAVRQYVLKPPESGRGVQTCAGQHIGLRHPHPQPLRNH
jgi:hypothetical protein